MIKQDVSETDVNQPLAISTEDSQDGQITAEVVQADLPSPGKAIIFQLIRIIKIVILQVGHDALCCYCLMEVL